LGVFEVLPELLHNSVVGYPYPTAMQKKMAVVMLRSGKLHPRVLVQMDAVNKVLEEADITHEIINAKGDSLLAQVLSLILLGDFMSCYLAILHKVDPSPVAIINKIKKYRRNTDKSSKQDITIFDFRCDQCINSGVNLLSLPM